MVISIEWLVLIINGVLLSLVFSQGYRMVGITLVERSTFISLLQQAFLLAWRFIARHRWNTLISNRRPVINHRAGSKRHK